MLPKKIAYLWGVAFLLIVPSIAVAVLVQFLTPSRPNTLAIAQAPQTRATQRRNLFLQPEAAAMAQRIGRRFATDRNERSTIEAVVTISGVPQALTIVRQQTSSGERVEIRKAALSGTLSWEKDEGARVSGSPAADGERKLIERVVFDSVDQFILAQLRGASYRIIASNVRPTDAGDDYSGPTWTIIRINDPQPDATKRGESSWRLYYLNSSTGLIDRIESEVQRQLITAEIVEWSQIGEEKVPREIVWNRDGQRLMQYTLTNFTFGNN